MSFLRSWYFSIDDTTSKDIESITKAEGLHLFYEEKVNNLIRIRGVILFHKGKNEANMKEINSKAIWKKCDYWQMGQNHIKCESIKSRIYTNITPEIFDNMDETKNDISPKYQALKISKKKFDIYDKPRMLKVLYADGIIMKIHIKLFAPDESEIAWYYQDLFLHAENEVDHCREYDDDYKEVNLAFPSITSNDHTRLCSALLNVYEDTSGQINARNIDDYILFQALYDGFPFINLEIKHQKYQK